MGSHGCKGNWRVFVGGRRGGVNDIFNQREEAPGSMIDRPVRIPIILWSEWRSESLAGRGSLFDDD